MARQRLGDFNAAGLQLARQRMQRIDDVVAEPLDARPERARHVVEAVGELGVDVAGEFGERMGQRFGARAQALLELGRLGDDALRDVAAAFAERLGGVERAAGEAFLDREGSRRQRGVDALKNALERTAHLFELVGGAAVGGFDAQIEHRNGFDAAPRETLVEFSAAHDDSLFDGRQRRIRVGR